MQEVTTGTGQKELSIALTWVCEWLDVSGEMSVVVFLDSLKFTDC